VLRGSRIGSRDQAAAQGRKRWRKMSAIDDFEIDDFWVMLRLRRSVMPTENSAADALEKRQELHSRR